MWVQPGLVCDRVKSGHTNQLCGEAAMAKLLDGVGIVAMAGTHKTQEGASGWVRCSHWQ
jgi:hypothetical protein